MMRRMENSSMRGMPWMLLIDQLSLAQRFRESNQSLPNLCLIVGGKTEDQCLRIRTPQGVSISGENLNALSRRPRLRLPRGHSIFEEPNRVEPGPDVGKFKQPP